MTEREQPSFMEELRILDRALEPSVGISRSQFWKAVNEVWQGQQTQALFEQLAQKLGLEPDA